MTKITIRPDEAIPTQQQNVQRLWLVRHGLTLWNMQQRFCGHTNVPLSVHGRAQAHWLASQLRCHPLTTIYTSDLDRAQATAKIIATKRPQPAQIIASPAWREIDFGAWEGLTYTEIATTYADQLGFFTDPEHHAPPGGESLPAVLQRVQPAFAQIMHDNSSFYAGDIVIVSHGGTLRALLSSLLGMPLSRQWQLRIDPGSLSAIDLSLDELGSPLATLVLLNFQHSNGRIRTGIAKPQETGALRDA